jgi:hypothetical protein
LNQNNDSNISAQPFDTITLYHWADTIQKDPYQLSAFFGADRIGGADRTTQSVEYQKVSEQCRGNECVFSIGMHADIISILRLALLLKSAQVVLDSAGAVPGRVGDREYYVRQDP